MHASMNIKNWNNKLIHIVHLVGYFLSCFPGISKEQLHRVLDKRDPGTPDTVVIQVGTKDLNDR
jgi:hypothetical protein